MRVAQHEVRPSRHGLRHAIGALLACRQSPAAELPQQHIRADGAIQRAVETLRCARAQHGDPPVDGRNGVRELRLGDQDALSTQDRPGGKRRRRNARAGVVQRAPPIILLGEHDDIVAGAGRLGLIQGRGHCHQGIMDGHGRPGDDGDGRARLRVQQRVDDKEQTRAPANLAHGPLKWIVADLAGPDAFIVEKAGASKRAQSLVVDTAQGNHVATA